MAIWLKPGFERPSLAQVDDVLQNFAMASQALKNFPMFRSTAVVDNNNRGKSPLFQILNHFFQRGFRL